jgi:signal peptidase I
MNQPQPLRRASPIAIAMGIVAFAIIWIIFAPMSLGGQAAYVIINGNSMSPVYAKGDLVILRRVSAPQVGDIIAYHHPEIGPIIHRIIDTSGKKFIFKGDNNGWIDSYQPEQTELIGKAWIHIPRLGKGILWLRQPLVMAALTALIGGLFMIDLFTGPARKKTGARVEAASAAIGLTGGLREALMFLFTLGGLAGLGLGILAFSAPETIPIPDNVEYAQTAAFRYTALADPAVYDTGTVQSGEPVFDKLTCNMDVALAYALSATQPADMQGTYRILARVSEINGWNRTYELQPRTPFSGGAFNTRVALNLCEIRALTERVMELTGLQRTLFNVVITAQIDLRGRIGGRDVTTSATPQLKFGLDNSQLYLMTDESGPSDALRWEQSGLLPGVRNAANSLALPGFSLPVSLARLIALGMALAAVLGLAAVGIPMWLAARQDELALAYAKYAHLIVKIRGQSHQVGASLPTVDVASMDDLARIAQQTGTLIMENAFADQRQFVVFAHGQCFRYAVNTLR